MVCVPVYELVCEKLTCPCVCVSACINRLKFVPKIMLQRLELKQALRFGKGVASVPQF